MTHYIDQDAEVRNHFNPLLGDVVAGGTVQGVGVTIDWQDGEIEDPKGDGSNILNKNGASVRDVLLACKLRLQHLNQDASITVSDAVLSGLQQVINACPENR